MRNLLFVCALGFLGWTLWGCASSESVEPAAAAKPYQCSMCKDTVTWTYNPYSSKQLPTSPGIKQVKHECPTCKKEWTASMSAKSTCADCGKESKVCPMCAVHSG